VSKRTLINLIFFNAIFGVMIFWAVNNIVTVDAIERPYEITGDFAQASGVATNAEVTYLGVNYGRVSEVERREGGVRVTMRIDRDKDLPRGAIARVFRKSAIGEPYIDFVPPESYTAADTRRIEPGEHIPQDRTTVPLEFSELLRSASALISGIDPDAAGGLVEELALALEGRGDSLRSLTESFDEITGTFAARTDVLDRLAENSTRLTRVLADRRLSLSQSISNLRTIADTLRDADGDTQVLLDVGPDFLGTTADLVADQKRNLDCLLTDLATITRTAGGPEQLDDLAGLLANGPTAFGYVANAVDREADGPWIRINLVVPTDGAPPAVYSPPRSLPVVPTISPCASALQAASAAPFTPDVAGSSTPSSATGSATPAPVARPGAPTAADPLAGGSPLADTGGEPLAALAAFLVAGALGTWRARRAA
jgi:phospholipid/cholesterol/gamma-HCH transport system substrate-binding protein